MDRGGKKAKVTKKGGERGSGGRRISKGGGRGAKVYYGSRQRLEIEINES